MASTASDSEVEPVVPRIIYEPKGKKNMVANLRARFKEWQHKRLYESIIVATPPAKRPYPEETCEAPVPDTPLMPMPPTKVAGPNNVLVAKSLVRKDTCPTQDGAPIGSDPVDDDLDKKDATTPLCAPNWEEIAEMLKWVPCFTEVEPPSTKMLNFFSLTKQILVNLDGNPFIFVSS